MRKKLRRTEMRGRRKKNKEEIRGKYRCKCDVYCSSWYTTYDEL